MCAEEIPLAATSCEYCGAHFEVTSTGYCQNCHQVRDVDGNGQCKVCGNAILDLRVESRLVEEPVKETTPTYQPAIRKTNRYLLQWGILVGVVLIISIVGFLLFRRNDPPAAPSLMDTLSPITTSTFAPTSAPSVTPTLAPTHTPRPTPKPTTDHRILNPANQHLYLYVKERKTWHEARDYCAAQNGHLVTIQAPSENRFIYELATENHDVGTWLGATDEAEEGTWVWVTGEPASYWNWGEYWNYSGKSGAEDFLTFGDEPRTWSAGSDDKFYFVCEWEP